MPQKNPSTAHDHWRGAEILFAPRTPETRDREPNLKTVELKNGRIGRWSEVRSPARQATPPRKEGSGTPTSIQDDFLNRADRPEPTYLRAAQAYMLISMPTDTSTIFGVFQVIQTSMDLRTMAPHEIRTGIDVTQVVTSKRNVEPCTTTISAIGAARDPLWCSAPSRPGFRPCPDWPH